jgi:hypothetical protein
MFDGMAQHRAARDAAAKTEDEHILALRTRQHGQMADERLRAQVET